jgi:hypothetical protein
MRSISVRQNAVHLGVDKAGYVVWRVFAIGKQPAKQAGAKGDPDEKAERLGLWHRWRS